VYCFDKEAFVQGRLVFWAIYDLKLQRSDWSVNSGFQDKETCYLLKSRILEVLTSITGRHFLFSAAETEWHWAGFLW